jgi:hypothetical protein
MTRLLCSTSWSRRIILIDVTVFVDAFRQDIFIRLCRDVAAKGNLVPDAYFAALAIESGSEWITADRD